MSLIQQKILPRNAFMEILNRISAGFQMGVLSQEERNKLVMLARKALQENSFDELYSYCVAAPAHPLYEELKEIMIMY